MYPTLSYTVMTNFLPLSKPMGAYSPHLQVPQPTLFLLVAPSCIQIFLLYFSLLFAHTPFHSAPCFLTTQCISAFSSPAALVPQPTVRLTVKGESSWNRVTMLLSKQASSPSQQSWVARQSGLIALRGHYGGTHEEHSKRHGVGASLETVPWARMLRWDLESQSGILIQIALFTLIIRRVQVHLRGQWY